MASPAEAGHLEEGSELSHLPLSVTPGIEAIARNGCGLDVPGRSQSGQAQGHTAAEGRWGV